MRQKSRLTITLAPEILARLDRLIDGRSLRNRSQAIETLLRRSLRPSVQTAVILAGGEPEEGRAPALALIDGEALILHTVRHAIDHGIRSFVVLGGPGEKGIKELLGDGRSLGVSMRYIGERRPRGTAGALKLAEPFLSQDPFLVIHGDVLTDIHLADFIEFHFNERCLATIAVKPREADRRFGKDPAWMRPVATPPFYGAEIFPAMIALTACGIRIDPDARALTRAGRPIAGLYAAGETTGGPMGLQYAGSGSSIANSLVFGRIAGRSAARSAHETGDGG